jgi:ADP-heptose:LPS heptosyltransferase
MPSVVSWGPGERDLAETAVRASEGHARPGPEPRGLKALARLIDRSGLFVAGDTGALHLAAYLGVPTVGLFGPKDPKVYAPRGRATAVVWTGHDCSPCPKRSCPDPVCMTSITPELAWDAVDGLLKAAPPAVLSGSSKGNPWRSRSPEPS